MDVTKFYTSRQYGVFLVLGDGSLSLTTDLTSERGRELSLFITQPIFGNNLLSLFRIVIYYITLVGKRSDVIITKYTPYLRN